MLLIVCPHFVSAASLTLAWDPPTDGLTTGYIVYYGTASHSYTQQVGVGGATLYTVTGLNDGTTYYFSLRGHDALGVLSDFSSEVQATTAPGAPPTATALSLSASLPSPQIVGTTVTWLASAAGGVTPYQFQWSLYGAGSWTAWPWTSASTWTWAPSVPGSDYQVKVAVRSSGSSNSAGELTQTAPFSIAPLPSAPVAFTKTAPVAGTSGATLNPTVIWAASSGAASYEYCVDTRNDNKCGTAWTNVTMLAATLSALTPNTTYWWQVRARNAAGVTEANASTWWSFRTAKRRP